MWDDDPWHEGEPAHVITADEHGVVRKAPSPQSIEEYEEERRLALQIPDPDPDVLRLLQRRPGKDGSVGAAFCNTHNVQIILENDRRLCDRLAWDEWREVALLAEGEVWRPLDDAKVTGLVAWIQSVYGLQVGAPLVLEAIGASARQAVVNEVVSYLEGVEWDGVPRIDGLLVDYFGCEAHHLTSAYSRRWMIQAVARAMRPGCIAQSMIVVQGAQGTGKTRGVAALAGEIGDGVRLAVDLPTDRPATDRDSLMSLRRGWIVNVDELESLARTSIAAVKAWITSSEDTYRDPYDRMPRAHKRHCVLIGSTNLVAFLHDSTGSRRFWVAAVEPGRRVDVEGLARDRDQLWAEAVAALRAGEEWHLTPEEEALLPELNARWQSDGWREAEIDAYLEHAGSRVSVADIIDHLAQARPVGDEGKARARIEAHLQRDGWSKSPKKGRVGGRIVRFWFRDA